MNLTVNRREFCKTGIALTAGLVPLGDVALADIPAAVPAVREAGYRMIFWTDKHTFIEASISDIRAEWGKLVFLGQSNIWQTDRFAGLCVMRPNAEIVMSRTFASNVCVNSGDVLKCNAALTWMPEGSVEQVMQGGSRVPRGRVVRRGFEPSVHANKGPSITGEDLELFFPEKFA
jgi:hypothetical protein